MASDSGLIVSVSGVRGIVGESLTPAVALAFASAYARHVGGGSVLLCGDGRPSGRVLRHAILAGLLAGGCDVVDLDVAPTPTVGLAVRTLRAAGAIQITASHNPAPWNGLKLFGPDGRVLSAAEGRKIQQAFEAGAARYAAWDRLGRETQYRRAGEDHRDRILELIDVPRIRAAGLKAYVDANGGAGGPLARMLLASLGVHAVLDGCDADGVFVHEPEPTADNLRDVAPRVAQTGCAVGFALDPDSDRLALIDEAGRYVGEELTLALAAEYRLRHAKGPVVINMSTSRVTEDIAARHGCDCVRSAVGEANVADRMLAVGAVLGGEGNGGVMDPRVGLVRDPFIGLGLVLNLMAETGKPLSELVAALPAYHIVKDKCGVAREKLPALFTAVRGRWPGAKANTEDGLRLDWADRWVHVRPSNTEPIIRIIAEAPREAEAHELCATVGALASSS